MNAYIFVPDTWDKVDENAKKKKNFFLILFFLSLFYRNYILPIFALAEII